MMQYEYSQLPVMQGERDVKGVITWQSIGMKLSNNGSCTRVGDCYDDARVVESDVTLFDAIPTIVDFGYVLVRQRDKKISGIVTASDLSLQFQALSEPFLLLREIELHVRRLLVGKISTEDLSRYRVSETGENSPQQISDFTFGQYVRLLEHPEVWKQLGLTIDRAELTKLLDEVRKVRNDVMHFDPDPMTPEQLETLKRAARLLQKLFAIKPSGAGHKPITKLIY
jgi:hypothetical protein